MSGKLINKLFIFFALLLFTTQAVFAQSSSFTYQGKISDGGIPANGTYQFEFKLYDSVNVGSGNQVGSTLSGVTAQATNGIFSVQLDFGAAAFDGNARYLEISLKPNGSQNPYTTLSPRQPITSTPYAVRSLNSQKADLAINANDSIRLGSIPASEYVQTTDTRMSDARNPLAGSSNYIQNTTSQQSSSNFNVSGEGKAVSFDAATQFKLAGFRVLGGNPAQNNLFVGVQAGNSNTDGGSNTFVGRSAGFDNLSGSSNTFVGFNSGRFNNTGFQNSFFGQSAGLNNKSGSDNSMFGNFVGTSNTSGSFNSFFGAGAGYANKEGNNNAFFGMEAGSNNTTGGGNTFLGRQAGLANTTENDNTFIGYKSNGAAGITNATAIGANATVTTSNTMVLGTNAVTVFAPGSYNTTSNYKIGGNRVFHVTGTDNAFVGVEAGNAITSGMSNVFFGKEAGKNTTTGFNNSFIGAYTGRDNIAGTNNSFVGANAGLSNRASFNSFFGSGAGLQNFNGASNSFFGTQSGQNNSNGQNNTFIGRSAGSENTTSSNNTFIGALSGLGENGSPLGDNNTAIGYNTKFSAGVSNSVAIGANVHVLTSNTIQLGNINDAVRVPGDLSAGDKLFANDLKIGADLLTVGFVGSSPEIHFGTTAFTSSIISTGQGRFDGEIITKTNIRADGNGIIDGTVTAGALTVTSLASGGNNDLCYKQSVGSSARQLATCSSSIRYKNNIQNFTGGLNLINRLRPVTFDWKSDGKHDVGFVAEEVNEVEPLLSTFNNQGQVEGVKYAQITTALVNAVKEQQTQIEQQKELIKLQQQQIDALKALVCGQNPNAAICQPDKK